MDQPIDMHARKRAPEGSALWTAPMRMIRSLMKWRKRRRMLMELMALDDHLLKDIGFKRDEVLKALHSGGLPERIDWRTERFPETIRTNARRRSSFQAQTAGRPCPM